MAFLDDRPFDRGADLGFGAPRGEELPHARVHPVDGGARPAQRVDFRVPLDHPQFTQDRGGRCGQAADGLGERDQMQSGHRVGHRDPRTGVQGGFHQLIGVHAVDPVEYL